MTTRQQGDRSGESTEQLLGEKRQSQRKNPEYREWMRAVTTKMPHLSKPQAVVLAMWSFGMVMTGCCGLSTVAVFLALLLGKKENTVRQQLKEWYKDKGHKKGKKRAELDVTTCFAPLLAWMRELVASLRKVSGTGFRPLDSRTKIKGASAQCS